MSISEEQIKESFQKAKKDVEFLSSELILLKKEISLLREQMVTVCGILENLTLNLKEIKKKQEIISPKEMEKTQKEKMPKPTQTQYNETIPTNNPTQNLPLEPQKDHFLGFSTGNGGVPTDRQTNQQTDRQTPKTNKNPIFIPNQNNKSPIEDAIKILDSLDVLKKEIRLKFKQLTDQEILVFSTLYQLEEEQENVDYRILANKLGLTESSIRDYIGKLLKKGIPVEKRKRNNKQVQLGISQNLKKIASLSTILQLRDL